MVLYLKHISLLSNWYIHNLRGNFLKKLIKKYRFGRIWQVAIWIEKSYLAEQFRQIKCSFAEHFISSETV